MRDARHRTPITQPDGRTAMPGPPSPPTPQAQTRAAQRRARRLATSTQVWTLHHQGWSPRLIAQHLGLGRMTVARALQAPTVPERKGRRETRQSRLRPYTPEILTRWNAGCREARHLLQALQRQGYPGSYPTVARYVQRLRHAQGLRPRARRPGPPLPRVVAGRHTPLTTRRATRLGLTHPLNQTDEDTPLMAHLKGQHGDRAVAIELAQDVAALVRARQADRFDSWRARAIASAVVPLRRCATGLRTDEAAVQAGRRLPWRNGPVEGQINRVNMLQRSMCGRAKIDLRSQRCLHAA